MLTKGSPAMTSEFIVNEKRKKIWQAEIDLLEQIKRVCSKYELTYYAINGTLLGAVRHHGFIPWDDDLDILMPRPDYDKLIEVAADEFSHPYLLHFPTDDRQYYRNYLRLRNENTTAIPIKDYYQDCSKGIFIDIFPLDGARPGKIGNIRYQIKTALLSEMANSYIYYEHFQKHRLIRWFLKSLADRYISKKSYMELLGYTDRVRSATDYSEAEYTVSILHGNKVTMFPKSYFGEGKKYSFEDTDIIIPDKYDEILTELYGDYMTIPPIEKCLGYHKIYFDPDRPYCQVNLTYEQIMEQLKY